MSSAIQPNPEQALRPTAFVAEGTFMDAAVHLQTENGKYKLVVEGNVHDLTTNLFQIFAGKHDKLFKGGSVVVFCYALYKLGLKAYNFGPGSVAFVADLDEDEQANLVVSTRSGKFRTTLQDTCMEAIRKFQLSYLEDFQLRAISIVERAEVRNTITGGTYTDTSLQGNAGHVYEHGAEPPVRGQSGGGERNVTNIFSGGTFEGTDINLNAGNVYKGPKKN